MTRFTITMNDALEFILNASGTGKGSEIFIPKLKSYEMPVLIETLSELCGKTEQQISGIRPGEKLHETLINHDEIRYAWEINNMYMLANPHYKLFNDSDILENYDGKIHQFGIKETTLNAKIKIHNPKFYFNIIRGGSTALAESYIRNEFETSNLPSLI